MLTAWRGHGTECKKMKTSPTKWLNENVARDAAQLALGIVLAAALLAVVGYLGILVPAIWRFVWLAFMSFGILCLAWPAAILLCVGGYASLALGLRLNTERFRSTLLWAFSPLVLPATILLIAAVFWYDEGPYLRWPEVAITILLLSQLPLGAALILSQRGARWFVLALWATIFAYSIGAWMMSYMAVTGDWV